MARKKKDKTNYNMRMIKEHKEKEQEKDTREHSNMRRSSKCKKDRTKQANKGTEFYEEITNKQTKPQVFLLFYLPLYYYLNYC